MVVEPFFNSSSYSGQVVQGLGVNVVGGIVGAILLMVLLVILLALAFRIPIEYTVLLCAPLLIAGMAFSGGFVILGGVFILYMGFLAAKNWPTN